MIPAGFLVLNVNRAVGNDDGGTVVIGYGLHLRFRGTSREEEQQERDREQCDLSHEFLLVNE
jgi:hypothetical protein